MKELEEILDRLHKYADSREMFLFGKALNDVEALCIRLLKENESLKQRILDLIRENQDIAHETYSLYERMGFFTE